MLPKPGIFAIDDDQSHLDAIAETLNSKGAACLKLLFRGGIQPHSPLERVRVLFIDLHLSQAGFLNETQHFSVIGGILQEHINQENGPFVLLLWTQYPESVGRLAEFLSERLQDNPHAIPSSVDSLSKVDYLRDGKVVNADGLVQRIVSSIVKVHQIAALMDWERRVINAASDTITAILNLVPPGRRSEAALVTELGRVLNALAYEAVGPSNVVQNHRAAVNEALVPILYDRVSQVHIDAATEDCWTHAFPDPVQKPEVTQDDAAKLNCMLHLDLATGVSKKSDRGMVLRCPDAVLADAMFIRLFGMTRADVATKQLGLKADFDSTLIKWLVVQVEAVCDHAQGQPGPVPFVLGAECPLSVIAQKTPLQAVWQTPVLRPIGHFSG